ncbi:MAG TPA: transposase [Chloroflexota bacterium]|nr:transposase [Chloroflexota bacterium]
MGVERSAAAILGWSWWRRWHQAWARYYHDRKRGGPEHQACDELPPASSTSVTDSIWQRLAPLLPATHRRGRPYAYDRWVVLEAILYVMQTGCAWHMLPARFPPWQTVYAPLVRWQKTGIWDTIWAGLDTFHPTDEVQL